MGGGYRISEWLKQSYAEQNNARSGTPNVYPKKNLTLINAGDIQSRKTTAVIAVKWHFREPFTSRERRVQLFHDEDNHNGLFVSRYT